MRYTLNLLLAAVICVLGGCAGGKQLTESALSRPDLPGSPALKGANTYTMWSDSAHHPLWQTFAMPELWGGPALICNNNRYEDLRIAPPIQMDWNPESAVITGLGAIWGSPAAHWIPDPNDLNMNAVWVSYRLYTVQHGTNMSAITCTDPESDTLQWQKPVNAPFSPGGINLSSPLTTREFDDFAEISLELDLSADERWVFAVGADGTLNQYIDQGAGDSGLNNVTHISILPPPADRAKNVWGSPVHGSGSGYNAVTNRYNYHNVCYTASFEDLGSPIGIFYCVGYSQEQTIYDNSAVADIRESMTRRCPPGWDTSSTPAVLPPGPGHPDGRAFIIESNSKRDGPSQARLVVIDINTGVSTHTESFPWYPAGYADGQPSRVSPVIGPTPLDSPAQGILVSTPQGVRVYDQSGMTLSFNRLIATGTGGGGTWETVSMPVVAGYMVNQASYNWTLRYVLYTIERRTGIGSPAWRVRYTEYSLPAPPFTPLPDWLSDSVPGECWSQPYVDRGLLYVADERFVYGWEPFDIGTGTQSLFTAPIYQSAMIGSNCQTSVCCPFENVSYDLSDSKLYVGSDIGTVREFGTY